MTPSEDLFKLIRSLTPNEKGYFKKFSRIHVREGKNNYMLLFEAIEKQEAYDEQAIINKFRNEQFVKQFPVAKNYLYNLILKALDVYHSGVDLEIGYLIHCSIILTDKAMFEPALKFLKKAEQLARDHHKLSYLNKILNHELYILRRDTSSKKKEVLQEHYRQRVENAHQLEYVIEYQHLNDLMNEQLSFAFGNQRSEAVKEADKLMKQPLMKNVPEGMSLYAQLEYRITCLYYQLIKQDKEGAYNITSFLVNDLLKKNESILSNSIRTQLLEYHCSACMDTGRAEEAMRILDRLKQVETLHELERLALNRFISMQELRMSLEKGTWDDSREVIELIEKDLDAFSEKLHGDQKATLFYMAAFSCFAHAQYKEALKWVNHILNSKLSDFRADVVSSFKLMELLIFFEMGKNDIIHYKMESFERSFKKDKDAHRFELLLISHLKKMLHDQPGSKLLDQARTAKKEIAAFIEKNPGSADVLYHFDICSWLESKAAAKPFAEVLAAAH